jgi:hypothetical protein
MPQQNKHFGSERWQKQDNPLEGVKEQAEAATGAVGTGMRNLAESVRQNAPHEGMIGQAAERVAQTIERSGNYLEQEGIEGLLKDVGTLVRRNPLPALLVGVGLGFLIGQLCHRSQQ